MREIEKLKRPIQIERLPRVAAYARVSTDTDRLRHSLSEQVGYYSSLISNTPGWIFAGIYSDEGITGTDTSKRNGFLKMLDDCDNGNIDIILTKSIQRFARNTVDLLQTIRHLKDIGVEVRFERENISTFSKDGELMLTVIESLAQDESRSTSENIRWSIRKKFEDGIPQCHFNIYGYRWEGDTLVPVLEEANVVRMMFDLYLNGMTKKSIAEHLNSSGILNRSKRPWDTASIKRIMRNSTYTGDLLLQKQYVTDSFPRKKKNNKGELPQYLVQDSHQAIVSRSILEQAEIEKQRRRSIGNTQKVTAFTGKIVCGQCGCRFHRNRRHGCRFPYSFWVCGGKEKKLCSFPGDINEDVLKAACAKILGTDTFDERVFNTKVDHITVESDSLLSFSFTDGSETQMKWNLKNRVWHKGRPCPALTCGICGTLLHRTCTWTDASGKKTFKYYCTTGEGHPNISEKEAETLLSGMDFNSIDTVSVFPDTLPINLRSGEKRIISRSTSCLGR